MKKVKLLIISLILSVCLVGCNIYADTSKKDMELIEIKVYDKDNNEIVGEYKNFGRYDYSTLTLTSGIVPLNSAAPVENYYFVNVKENESYIVKFIFHSSKGYKLTKLVLNNDPQISKYGDDIECENIEKVDNNYVVTLNVEKVEEENQFYHIIGWYRGEVKTNFSTKGSNTYIKGVYFVLDIPSTTSC